MPKDAVTYTNFCKAKDNPNGVSGRRFFILGSLDNDFAKPQALKQPNDNNEREKYRR